MSTFYHGTTKAGLKAILDGEGKIQGPWICSDRDGLTYLWNPARLIEIGEIHEPEEAIRYAFESAQFQAATMGEDTTLYVIELELDDDEIEVDLSCENMEHCSTTRTENVTPDRIVRVYASPFNKWLSPYVLAGHINSDLFNSGIVDEGLLRIANMVAGQSIFCDEIYEIDWEEVDLDAVAEEFGLDPAAFGQRAPQMRAA